MAEFPYMPLWTDAYLADTRHLTTVEHGAYLLLMMEAWRRPSCSLPDDDRMLARLAGLTADEWAEIKPVVMALWSLDGRSNEWAQKRLKKERSKSTDRSRLARDKAAKRWKATETDDAAALPGQCPDDANQNQNQSHTQKEKTEAVASAKKRGSRLPSDWKLPRAWGEWAVGQRMSESAVRKEADKFRDYWLSAPGQKGVKADWEATWRNWIRKAVEDGRARTSEDGSGLNKYQRMMARSQQT